MTSMMLPKDSPEYAEIVSAVFADVIRRSALDKVADDSEITPSLLQAMEYVYLHGSSPIHKIASGLSISFSAASQLVDRLVRKSLAMRGEPEGDRRLAAVDLTLAGRDLVAHARQERTQWMARVLSGMPGERRRALVESLEEFIRVALSAEEDIEAACVRCGIDHLAFCVLNQAHMDATGEQIENY